jgi:hypothetical protein
VGREERDEVLLEPAGVVDDVAAGDERAWPEKRTPKLTIGSSATVAVSPNCSRAQ